MSSPQPGSSAAPQPPAADAPPASAVPDTEQSASSTAAPPQQVTVNSQHIEADEDISTESDSAYGDDIQSYATSLTSSVQNYQWEHGRRYHAYREGTYNFPNDEREQDRMDLYHAIVLLCSKGKLHNSPVVNPKRILDMGTGTGIWAIDVGDLYPAAEVIGNDLSPIQPKWVPPNVHFEVDDIESEWPARPGFDLVHGRILVGGIKDWPTLMQNCYNQTNEGGWTEIQDLDLEYYCEDGSAGPENKVLEFHQLVCSACEKVGRTAKTGRYLKEWMEAAGFRNVREEIHKLPLGPWAKDKTLKQIGGLNLIQLLDGLEGFAMAPFTRIHGWTLEQLEVYLAEVRTAAKQKSTHVMYNYHIVYGQR